MKNSGSQLRIVLPFIPAPARIPTRASLVVQTVENLPAMQETWFLSPGWEDPRAEGMATHSSTLAWKIPLRQRSLVAYSPWGCNESDMTEQLGRAQQSDILVAAS